MNGNVHSVDRPVPHITLMGATNRALTFRNEVLGHEPGGRGWPPVCMALSVMIKETWYNLVLAAVATASCAMEPVASFRAATEWEGG